MKFGIFSDIMGVREDIPYIKMNKAYSPESVNVWLRNGEARRMKARLKCLLDADGTKVATPDGNPVLRYHRFLDAVGNQHFFGMTKAHIYKWNTSTCAWDLKHTCSADCTMWDSVSFNKKVIATNNVDKIIYWDSDNPGNDFAALDDADDGLDLDGGSTFCTAAKYIAVYENYVIIGHTTEGGTAYPFRIRWCSLKDETDWQSDGGSGDAGKKDFLGGEHVVGFGHYTANAANWLVVFKKQSIHAIWLVTDETVFATTELNNAIGLLATESAINDKDGNLYFIGSDYSIRKLFEPDPISKAIRITLRNMHPTLCEYAKATFINEFNQLVWTIPSGGSSTENDYMVIYDIEEKLWYKQDFGATAFGDYVQQDVYTIDTIPFSSIDGITWETIDTVENITGWFLDVCGDSDGYTYSLHTAEADRTAEYTGSLVLSTDLSDKQSLMEYKRVNSMILYFNAEASTDYEANIHVKEEDDTDWQSVGTVTLDGNGTIVRKHLPCDLRSRDFRFKISATNKFDFIGAVFDFYNDGDR